MLKAEGLQSVLRDETRLPRVPEPGVIVIFGASGDLTARKLIPALYDLAAARRLPMEVAVVGISRTEMSHDAFRRKLRDALDKHRSGRVSRSEEHTSELQSRQYLVCRLLLEKKKKNIRNHIVM